MGKFLKQSPGLRDWATRFKTQAQYNLSIGAVIKKNYKGKGALGRSIRTVVRDGVDGVTVDILYNWYGNLVEAGGPFGPRRKFIAPRPWLTKTLEQDRLLDELVDIIATDYTQTLLTEFDKALKK